MRHHRGVLRRRAVLLSAGCLLLTSCVRLEAPAPDTVDPALQQPVLASVEPPSSAATATLEPACPPADPAEPVTADEMNRSFAEMDLPHWKQADVGTSAVLDDGRVVWVWGDTVRGREVKPRMADNSILVTSGTCVSQLLTEDRGAIIPETEDEQSMWPLSALRVDPRPGDAAEVTDVLVVFYSRVQRGISNFDFEERGTTVAIFTVGADGVPRVTELTELTPDIPDVSSVHWGAASAHDGDWVYLYGTRNTGEAQVYGRELYVARLPLAEVSNGAAMQFWDGTAWLPDSSRAAPVLNAVEGTSQRLSVDLVDGQWVALSKLGGDFADDVAVWTSDQPAGPFTPTTVLSVPFGWDTGIISYMPLAHPDVVTEPGSMLISYSRNVTDFSLLFKQPELGLPRFAQVPRP
jgi:hypothetical protein